MRAGEIILAVAIVAVIVYGAWSLIEWYFHSYLPDMRNQKKRGGK